MGIFLAKIEPSKPKVNSNPLGLRQCQEADVTGLVVDVIDTSDPSFETMEYKWMSQSPTGIGYCRSDVQILVREHEQAVDMVVSDVRETVAAQGKLRLLRFSGHGMAGYQSAWGGSFSKLMQDPRATQAQLDVVIKDVIKNPNSRVGIGHWNLCSLTGVLMKLCPCFGPNAEVWLMGCEVAAHCEGHDLLDRLAMVLGVPVQAGIPMQYSSRKNRPVNFLHEGAIRRGSPTLNPFAK
jgi:hypothetical protein